jgi:hypothetical protein
MTRAMALADFRRERTTWMRLAREHREAGAIELCAYCVEGARIASRNIVHVLRRVPA